MFCHNTSYLSVKEISEKLQLYPSAVHRILDTLRFMGYIEQDTTTQKYSLGLKVIEMGMAKLNQMNVVREASPYIKKLVSESNETVHLGVLEGQDVLYLDKAESSQTVRMVSRTGRRAPLHCTALGKVLLAHLPETERKKIISDKVLPRLTHNTITDKAQLDKELCKVKEQGFALDTEEHEKDVHCIAAPIRNYDGKVIAAVSISGPAFRVNFDKNDHVTKILIKTAENISRRMGYQVDSKEACNK